MTLNGFIIQQTLLESTLLTLYFPFTTQNENLAKEKLKMEGEFEVLRKQKEEMESKERKLLQKEEDLSTRERSVADKERILKESDRLDQTQNNERTKVKEDLEKQVFYNYIHCQNILLKFLQIEYLLSQSHCGITL